MNANQQRPDEAELQELSQLLPAPGEPSLFAARQRLLKDHLMHEIKQSAVPAQAPARRNRRRWALAVAPVAVAAVAAAVVVGTTGHSSPKAPRETALSDTVTVEPGSSHGVAALLDRVADVAASKPAITVGPDQFVYVKSEVAASSPVKQRTFDGPEKLGAVEQREVWLPEDPSRAGLIREGGKDTTMGGGDAMVVMDGAPAKPAGAGNTPNSQIAALPTDPDVLLKKIYADTKGQAPSRNGAAFSWIGDQIGEAIVPPKVDAAIWRAAAKIPGVVVVPDAVDAAGRHGEAVAHVDNGERTEYIFDKTTLNYLGERSYLVKNTSAGKAGQLTGVSAVISRAVVNKVGELPDHSA